MITTEEILSKIEAFADHAHGNQMRRYAPDRYIVHPKRVMESCRRVTADTTILAAALLHDVLEDTDTKRQEMLDFLKTLFSTQGANRVLQLVIDLTDVYIKKDFPHLRRRARKKKELQRLVNTHPDSQTVKYADIIDNVPEITTEDPDFAKVYLRECAAILKKLDKGNPELHKQATDVVNVCISELK